MKILQTEGSYMYVQSQLSYKGSLKGSCDILKDTKYNLGDLNSIVKKNLLIQKIFF